MTQRRATRSCVSRGVSEDSQLIRDTGLKKNVCKGGLRGWCKAHAGTAAEGEGHALAKTLARCRAYESGRSEHHSEAFTEQSERFACNEEAGNGKNRSSEDARPVLLNKSPKKISRRGDSNRCDSECALLLSGSRRSRGARVQVHILALFRCARGSFC